MTTLNSAPTFIAGDGQLTTDFGSTDDSGNSIAVQVDGQILVAGTSGGNFALARYNPDGSLNTSFSGDGKLTTDFGFFDTGSSMVVQADGKILIAGTSNGDFALARYNLDGSLDTAFAGDGKLTTDFGSVEWGNSVTVQTDGKILIAGKSGAYLNRDFALARYNPDGSLDTTFSGDGKVTTDFGFDNNGYSDDSGNSVAVQTDGKILVAGESNGDFALVRYNPDGSLDTSFSGDGKLTTDSDDTYDSGDSIAVQTDGKILVAGFNTYGANPGDFVLVRYNPDGSLDTTFSGDGKLTTEMNFWDSSSSVAVQTDGKILVAGEAGDVTYDSYTDFALARYNPDGSLDTTFSGDGKVITIISSDFDNGNCVTVQSDGKVLMAGKSNGNFVLVRYNSDGSLDTWFDMPNAVNTLDGTVDYTEDASAVVLDSDVAIRDAELDALNGGLGNYAGATLTLVRNGGASVADLFSAKQGGPLGALSQGSTFSVGNTAIGTVTANSGGTLTLAFNDNATTARVNEAMRQIAYRNSSDAPSSSVQIDWTFSDGNASQDPDNALGATGTTIVNIVPALVGTPGNDTLSGDQNGANNDVLKGLAGNDTLEGGDGDDWLDGGTGADTLTGGNGYDTYVVDHPGDVVREAYPDVTQIDKIDTVYSTLASYTLTDFVENLSLSGTTALNGTGNGLANMLHGNGAANGLNGEIGNDTLYGWAGADTLIGGTGNDALWGGTDTDTLIGGTGDDTYGVDHAGDRVQEMSGEGTDTVYSTLASYTLPANVENLSLSGTTALDGSGNSLANVLQGNGFANLFNGGAGDDVLYGWAGNDTLSGGDGNDRLYSGTGADTLIGGTGNDILYGGTDADSFVFNSRVGADTVTDFVSGTDQLRFSQAALPVGDGDTVLEGAVAVAGPGGFAPGAELVVVSQNLAGGITASAAAAAIGSATSAYAAGAHALFAVDNGSQSAVYYFTAQNANAAVEAGELVLLATLSATASTTLADYGLIA